MKSKAYHTLKFLIISILFSSSILLLSQFPIQASSVAVIPGEASELSGGQLLQENGKLFHRFPDGKSVVDLPNLRWDAMLKKQKNSCLRGGVRFPTGGNEALAYEPAS